MAEPPSETLQWNDAVHVTREGHDNKLEGVVAFTGSVSFADGDDWVGVRLTGASVGLGRNDGSVQDVVYFTCPANCGMFVREAAVTKRSLTRRYADNQGFAPCRTGANAGQCAFDPSFYSDYLKKPLGKPLNTRVQVGDYKWTREFEHATVTVDLTSPLEGTSIVFHKSNAA